MRTNVPLHGRESELAVLREWLGRTPGALVVLLGPDGVGKTALMERATGNARRVWLRAPGLTDPENRALFRDALVRDLDPASVPEADADWGTLFEALRLQGPLTLALDDVPQLVEANRKFLAHLGVAWRAARDEGSPFTLVMTGRARALGDLLNREGSPFRDPPSLGGARPAPAQILQVGPLHYGTIREFCPEWRGRDLLEAYMFFGGRPALLRRLDGSVRPSTNLRRLALGADASLADAPELELQRLFQAPARYGSVVRALAMGDREWRDVARRVTVFGGGGALAPYLARLLDEGLVSGTRSLDATARTRRTRYEPADLFDAFWWSCVHPVRDLDAARRGDVDALWTEHVVPALVAHMGRAFPRICRQYLVSEAARDRLGSVAREAGGLWGEGYHFPAAAALRGGAVVYGACLWDENPVDTPALDRIERDMRRTRWGFGREARLRVLFTTGEPTDALRQRRGRNELVRLITVRDLAG